MLLKFLNASILWRDLAGFTTISRSISSRVSSVPKTFKSIPASKGLPLVSMNQNINVDLASNVNFVSLLDRNTL